ncbi:MAG: LytTR family DNA-binding domain-containing protein [Lachnospiraceae bacterium]|nr:LytTR family DNA-binding domain-containing protein [Lachnospiraceae bacterium]
MYRIAVCDDNPADAAYVANFIKKWAADQTVTVYLEEFPSAEAFLFQHEEDSAVDILFLDVEMREDGMNGIELAAKIRERDHAVQIVFVTGYMDYIGEGYDVEALHYLLKPVTQEKLGSVIARAIQRVKDREKELFIQTADGSVRIPVGGIRYLEVQRNYVTIHCAEEYTVKKTLGELEKELDESFFRTGRSFIVNLRFVSKITKSQVLLKDGAAVPLSRGLYDAINRAVIRYF